jgi:hypothetical protein
MTTTGRDLSAEHLQLDREIEAAAQRAVRRALLEHKRAGNPVVFWENGQIRWVPADEIEIPPAPRETPPRPDLRAE